MDKKLKTWRIPVVWEMTGYVDVEAETLIDAISIARDEEGIIPLPDNSNYVDESWKVSVDDPEEIRSLYNNNQKDGNE